MSLNKPSKELLVDLINKNWGKTYPYADVVFENMLVMPYDAQRNTGITIKSAAGTSPLETPKQAYYDRIRLSDLVDSLLGADTVPEVEDEGYLTVHDLLADINALLGTALAAEDLENTEITDADYPRDVIVRASPTSLVFTGEFTLVLVNNVADVP